MQSIIIIGGDKRQTYLKEIFTEKSLFCRHINSVDENRNLNRISQYDVVMLPVPVTKDKEHIYSYNDILLIKIKDVLDNIRKGQTVFGGGLNEEIRKSLREKEVDFYDFFSSEDFAVYNAFLTAQGALKLLLDNTNEFIVSKKALVTGFGRVAITLCQFLKANGIEVYVAVRNKTQIVKAQCMGYKVLRLDSMKHCLHFFDFIFNTVPVNLFSADDVSHITGKYFELASRPYGADKSLFRKGYYIDGGGLPGKYTPYSSAERIAEFSLRYI